MQIKFNIPQAEQVDSSGDFRSRLATSSLVFARSLAVDLWQVYVLPKATTYFENIISKTIASVVQTKSLQCHMAGDLTSLYLRSKH